MKRRRATDNTADLPLYAPMPDLFSRAAVAAIMREAGLKLPEEEEITGYARMLYQAVRNSLTIRDTRPDPGWRDWDRAVAHHAAALRALLAERQVVGWGAAMDDCPAEEERLIDEVISDLPIGLGWLEKAARAAEKGAGGRPSNSGMRAALFAALAEIYEGMTGQPLKVRVKGISRDGDAAPVLWARAVLRHAASCYETAADDVFQSRDHAARLRELANVSAATLGDLLEAGRAKSRSKASVENPL